MDSEIRPSILRQHGRRDHIVFLRGVECATSSAKRLLVFVR